MVPNLYCTKTHLVLGNASGGARGDPRDVFSVVKGQQPPLLASAGLRKASRSQVQFSEQTRSCSQRLLQSILRPPEANRGAQPRRGLPMRPSHCSPFRMAQIWNETSARVSGSAQPQPTAHGLATHQRVKLYSNLIYWSLHGTFLFAFLKD